MEFKQGNKLQCLFFNRLCPVKHIQTYHAKTHVMRGSGRDHSSLAAVKSQPCLSLPGNSHLWYSQRETINWEGSVLPQSSSFPQDTMGNSSLCIPQHCFPLILLTLWSPKCNPAFRGGFKLMHQKSWSHWDRPTAPCPR